MSRLLALAVGTQLAALMSVPVLLVARHYWGRLGLWAAAGSWWAVLGSIAFLRLSRTESLDLAGVVWPLLLLIGWITVPTYLVDRAMRANAPSIGRTFGRGIIGYNVASAGVVGVVIVYAVVSAIISHAR